MQDCTKSQHSPGCPQKVKHSHSPSFCCYTSNNVISTVSGRGKLCCSSCLGTTEMEWYKETPKVPQRGTWNAMAVFKQLSQHGAQLLQEELGGMRRERGDNRKNAKAERWQPVGSIHALLLVTDPSTLFCEGKRPPSQQEWELTPSGCTQRGHTWPGLLSCLGPRADIPKE